MSRARRRLTSWVLGVLVAAGVVAVVPRSRTAPRAVVVETSGYEMIGPSVSARTDDEAAARTIEWFNDARHVVPVPDLRRLPDVDAVASDYASRVAASGRVAHEDEDGLLPDDRLARHGLSSSATAEVIGAGQDADEILRALILSTSHRRAIESSDFCGVGVGAVRDASGRVVIVGILVNAPSMSGCELEDHRQPLRVDRLSPTRATSDGTWSVVRVGRGTLEASTGTSSMGTPTGAIRSGVAEVELEVLNPPPALRRVWLVTRDGAELPLLEPPGVMACLEAARMVGGCSVGPVVKDALDGAQLHVLTYESGHEIEVRWVSSSAAAPPPRAVWQR